MTDCCTRTSPGPDAGTLTSSNFRTSGPPCPWMRTVALRTASGPGGERRPDVRRPPGPDVHEMPSGAGNVKVVLCMVPHSPSAI